MALISMEKRPILAGVLFGLAAVLKPQALVLLPLALIAAGRWKTFGATAFTGALAFIASVALFGFAAWEAWFAAVARFGQWVMTMPGLERGMITPTALAMNLRLDGPTTDIWRVAFGVGALAKVWFVFRKTEDPARRLAALFGGSLFITPYAMHYDAALLAPAAALILTRRPQPGAWLYALFAAALLCCAAIPHWGAAGVIAFTLIVALTPETALTRPWPALAMLIRRPQQAAG
jgi:hypothetical protein